MKNRKYSEKEVLIASRSISPEAVPSTDFVDKLGKSIKGESSSSVRNILNNFSKRKYLNLLPLFLLALIVTSFLIDSRGVDRIVPIDNSTEPLSVNEVGGELNNLDSPYLAQKEIKLDNSDLLSFDLYRERSLIDESGPKDIALSPSAISDDMETGITPTYSSRNLIKSEALKGGSVDDNLEFANFIDYVNNQEFDPEIATLFDQRFKIEIVDENGSGLVNRSFDVVDSNGNTYRLNLYNRGHVYFFPNVYKYGGQESNEYKVIFAGKEYTFSAQQETWRVEVDNATFANPDLLQIVFTVDTTGSMSDQIEKLKESMISISEDVTNENPGVQIRYGLVAYRDRGDEYITRVYDFTSDVQQFQSYLDSLEAGGGGDYPEDVNTALEDTIESLSWDLQSNSVKLVFLVADAPPHTDYEQEYNYETAMFRALENGIKIYPLASSGLDNSEGEFIFRQLAIVTNAKYLFITDSAGGTDYNVEAGSYSVGNLDRLITDIINEEFSRISVSIQY